MVVNNLAGLWGCNKYTCIIDTMRPLIMEALTIDNLTYGHLL